MTTLTVYSPSSDATTHQEAVGRDGTPEVGQPLGYCVAGCETWPCGPVVEHVGGAA